MAAALVDDGQPIVTVVNAPACSFGGVGFGRSWSYQPGDPVPEVLGQLLDQSLWDSFLKAVSDDLPGMRSVEKLKKLLAAACAVWALLLIPVWYFYTYSPDCGGAVGLSWLLAFGATYQALLWVGRREIKAADARCAQIAERYGAPFKESKVSIRYKRYDYKDVSGGATLLEFALTSTAGP